MHVHVQALTHQQRVNNGQGNHSTPFPRLSKANPREYIVSGWSKLNQAEAALNIVADTYFSRTEILAT
jgi:hypothetical protein